MMSKFGRKDAILMVSSMYAVSYLFLVVAPNPWFIYIGRFLTGICTGICSLDCPVYVGEIATPDNRGLLGSCIQGMVTVGVLLGMGIGSFNSWRWLSVV